MSISPDPGKTRCEFSSLPESEHKEYPSKSYGNAKMSGTWTYDNSTIEVDRLLPEFLPPRELVKALLECFTHCMVKQCRCNL